METEIEVGSIPNRNGFDVHVDGEDVFITQYNGGGERADVIAIHVSDVPTLISLLVDASDASAAEIEESIFDEACEDETCCPRQPTHDCCGAIDRSGEMR